MNSSEALYHRSPIWAQNLLLNAYAWKIERHRYGAPYRSALARLQEQESWSRDRMRDFQDERLRSVIGHAVRHSPYYRQLFADHGLRPEDIRGVDDLPRLPLLTKETVKHRGAELRTSEIRRGWLEGHTSGTTGAPLAVWYDRQTCVVNNAVDRRAKSWAGMGAGDWIGLLLGRVLVPPTQSRPPFWRYNRVHRQVWFSSFHLSGDNLEAYVREMRRSGLRFLEGYPSTLFILAKHLLRQGMTLPMRAVITSSETLHTVQREAMEAAFECRVFDMYGLAERVINAAECEHHAGKHLAEDYGVTEVVDDDGNPVPDGTPGYLVGTSLWNLAMPMIRYRTADVSSIVAEPCACGRPLRRIRDVTTKAEDIIVTADGRMISPSILTHPFKPLDQIVESQLVQVSHDHLVVKLVPSGEFTPETERTLVASLAERLGPGMRIEIRLVDSIPRERSGKFRWVISQVDHSCLVAWEARA